MPYIKQEDRQYYDGLIDEMVSVIRDNNERTGLSGTLNYIITRLVKGAYGECRYNDYNSIVGLLECAKMELYRRSVAPYEDTKIEENGDV